MSETNTLRKDEAFQNPELYDYKSRVFDELMKNNDDNTTNVDFCGNMEDDKPNSNMRMDPDGQSPIISLATESFLPEIDWTSLETSLKPRYEPFIFLQSKSGIDEHFKANSNSSVRLTIYHN